MKPALADVAARRADYIAALERLACDEQRHEVARLMVDLGGFGELTGALGTDARVNSAARQIAHALEVLRDHEPLQPAAVDRVIGALVAHLRSWRPVAVAHLGELPPPGERIQDPRGRA